MPLCDSVRLHSIKRLTLKAMCALGTIIILVSQVTKPRPRKMERLVAGYTANGHGARTQTKESDSRVHGLHSRSHCVSGEKKMEHARTKMRTG